MKRLVRLLSVVDDPEATIARLARYKQTGVSLSGLIQTGESHMRELQAQADPKTLWTVAGFLHRELPIRLSRRVIELDGMTDLSLMPSVRRVRDWYARSAVEIFESERPTRGPAEARFAALLASIYERHSGVLVTMARGAHELRLTMSDFETDQQIHGFLDSFYTSRIGIRMIIGQYLALRECTPEHSHSIGLLNTSVQPSKVAQAAVDQATALCQRQFGVAPPVYIVGRLDLTFSYVPDHLFYIMLELLKNSMRATCEAAIKQQAIQAYELDENMLKPIKVVVADGEDNEDVALKVSDQGGGIPRSHMPKVWSYLFTTAVHDWAFDEGSDFGGAPLAGLGYGLPISRAYARYFGGDLTLMSMEGFGTDAFVYLSRLGDHDEPLP